MKAATKMFTYARKLSRAFSLLVAIAMICAGFIYGKQLISSPDFGKSFGSKAIRAERQMKSMEDDFEACSKICAVEKRFMQSLVFPELMRYNLLQDGIEAESLRTLYVQFGKEYANFSVGLFQMKPGFAELVETRARQLLPDSINHELQLGYADLSEENIRFERIERLLDKDWQLVYLTAFVCICNELYRDKNFSSNKEKLQWYATLYNAGLNTSTKYIQQKIVEANFYLEENMPGKKFKYAAIATWFYDRS